MTTQVLIDFGPDQSSISLRDDLLNVFLYLMLATASMSHRQVTAPKMGFMTIFQELHFHKDQFK